MTLVSFVFYGGVFLLVVALGWTVFWDWINENAQKAYDSARADRLRYCDPQSIDECAEAQEFLDEIKKASPLVGTAIRWAVIFGFAMVISALISKGWLAS